MRILKGNRIALIAYVTKINYDLPYPVLVKPRKYTAIFPQEPRQVARFAKLSSNVKSLILLPAVNVRKDIWMAVSLDREGHLG